MCLRKRTALFLACCLLFASTVGAEPRDTGGLQELRIGLLRHGTVSWEAAVVKQHKFDEAAGFRLQIIDMASPAATLIALQSGAVDMVVSDWYWAIEQHRQGRHYRYYPYSNHTGGLITRRDAGIASVEDLVGKRIGVAGGPLDKSWIILQRYCQLTWGVDLNEKNDIRYGAPPIMANLLENGQLDAVVNYWHFNARSVAAGHHAIISNETMLKAMGVGAQIPMLGWVFDSQWGEANAGLVNGFISATKRAKQRMLEDDSEWTFLRPMMRVSDDSEFEALRAAWRGGIPDSFSAAQQQAIEATYRLLKANKVEVIDDSPSDQAADVAATVYWSIQ